MHINDLKKSKFLTQHDCDPPILVTIKDCAEMNIAQESAKPDIQIVLFFEEYEKGMVLKPTNGALIAAITGDGTIRDEDTGVCLWAGTRIVLYKEPSITYGGKITGGIRVRAPKNTAAKPLPKPKPIPVEPEPEQGQVTESDDIPF